MMVDHLSGPQPRQLREVGMSAREREKYSLLRAAEACCSRDWSRAGLEREVSLAALESVHDRDTDTGRCVVPFEVLRRDLTAGTGTAGGYLVGSGNAGLFIDALRPRSTVLAAGAQRVSGLVGNTAIPRGLTASSVGIMADESGAGVTESSPTYGQIAMTPKTPVAVVEVSRILRLQGGPMAEAIIRNDLAAQIAAKFDELAYSGTGASGQPLGLLNTAGIGTFNGASMTWANVLEAQTDILSANALPDGGGITFICRPAVAALLAQRQGFNAANDPIWRGSLVAGTLAGCPAFTTMNVPANTLVAGVFSQLMVGEWGPGIEIRGDPFGKFKEGIVAVGAFYSFDIGVRVPSAFSVATAVS